MPNISSFLSTGPWEAHGPSCLFAIHDAHRGIIAYVGDMATPHTTHENEANAQVIRASKALYLAATRILQWLPLPGENIPAGHLEAIVQLTKAIELAETPIQ